VTSGKAWPAEIFAEAVAAYRTGESAPSISRRLGCSTTAIYEWLREAGVESIKSRPNAGTGSPDLPDDVLAMPWMLSEAGAWALGLQATDGNLRRPKGRPGQHPSLAMRVALKAADRAGVAALAKAYGLDESRVRESGGMATFGFSHPQLDFLADAGAQPVGNKAGRKTLPECLVANPHALRGVMDGDGYVSLLQPAGRQPQLHVGLRAGSTSLRTQFARGVESLLGDDSGICVHSRGVTVTNTAGVRLVGLLYPQAITYTVPRKRLKAMRLAVEYVNAVTPPVAEIIISALVEAITGEDLEVAA
jgi:hypothetical protein